MALTMQAIERLFAERGGEQYSGEPVTQLEHALQCAALAQDEGGDDELIAAALLHDLGHLLHDFGATPTLRGLDDRHQYRALPMLRGVFAASVLGAIAGHVDAKRYLCATRPGYHDSLSEDSKRSLALQGGVFTPLQAERFIRGPHAQRAVQLRLWDDRAKAEGLATAPLGHFLQRARRSMLVTA
ncbi:MAG TPA: HD domain-containing protein [Ramlibacter sp.]|uniref:phosphonate degradation HD-domain oxygenase n=1 Tax=Ramlibacter sp. TaxID=1917967 RepID=UPI002D177038|nr:phosphonate degradation HD-domain oxygenase [Ramlibacter sp.]HVZ46994.1 HD domain-containing protein [Ramlibacter sp.]